MYWLYLTSNFLAQFQYQIEQEKRKKKVLCCACNYLCFCFVFLKAIGKVIFTLNLENRGNAAFLAHS